MSDSLNTPPGIRAGAYCGPDDGRLDRQRWQIETDGIVTLTREQVYWLLSAFQQSLWDRPTPDTARLRRAAGSPP